LVGRALQATGKNPPETPQLLSTYAELIENQILIYVKLIIFIYLVDPP